MFEENEDVVLEGTENVEELATEELVDGARATTETEGSEKLYSQADFDKMVNDRINELLPKKLERAKSKMQREYTERYGRLETTLKAGLQATGANVESVEDITNTFNDFYKSKGVNIPEQAQYSEHDLKLLANAEANEIISSGYDDLVEEVDRLAEIGADNMTPRERIVFQKLAEERMKQDSIKELAKIGISPEVLNNSEFKEFANKLNPSLSAKEKYEMYKQLNPKKEVEQIGSMKNNNVTKEVKSYYTPEEISKLTVEDLDNPVVWEAVRKSMTGQK